MGHRTDSGVVTLSGPELLRQIMADKGLNEPQLAEAMCLSSSGQITGILRGAGVGGTSIDALCRTLDLPLITEYALRTVYGCVTPEQWRIFGFGEALPFLFAYLRDERIPENKRQEIQAKVNELARSAHEGLGDLLRNI